ncbi:MAG TPA: LysE/ArgO family amino acid transporter [Geminicoccus sp.]|jgi:L-lysine exporter family protein LysE/ArgO|uniref:LysE/ArgO family amino acid transporter n=1 Tax=Geminicoccus sp. TaxID=2024832 RepID=UPI002E328E65|nr:LysE/ArgO family amino acid transporter [Geminicoccus sp.]HEX2528932.1 LysE/ArgO family amino acid transporter [Geminicoccus sp.]
MPPSNLGPALQGLALGFGLIVAIGAQNAFVLRCGLVRRFVLPVVLLCAFSDAILIAAGCIGLGTLISGSPGLLRAVAAGGALFLAWYGIAALRRALHPGALRADAGIPQTLGGALATAAAFTWLNPHVYLDTVVLLGSISARFAGTQRLAFGTGAAVASFIWFIGLGYGARLLSPLFARPAAWRVLDLIIAVVMFMIALPLARSAWQG